MQVLAPGPQAHSPPPPIPSSSPAAGPAARQELRHPPAAKGPGAARGSKEASVSSGSSVGPMVLLRGGSAAVSSEWASVSPFY